MNSSSSVGVDHEVAQRRPAQGLVHDAVGRPDLAGCLEPLHHVVVDRDAGRAGDRHGKESKARQDHGPGSVRPQPARSEKARRAAGPDLLPCEAFSMLSSLTKGEHRGDKAEAQYPQEDGPEGHEAAEDLDRDDVHEEQHRKTGCRGQRRVAHGPPHRLHGLEDGGLLVLLLFVAEVELVEDVDAVRGDGHQEHRGHGAHDVDGEAEARSESPCSRRWRSWRPS